MSKKKISSDDFLQLLDDQESTREKPAFRPRKTVEPELGPVQKELLDLALKTAPRLTRLATALVGRIRK